MESEQHHIVLACVVSGALFALLGSSSFSILWVVNWRPWRLYRFLLSTCSLFLFIIYLNMYVYLLSPHAVGSLPENGQISSRDLDLVLYVVHSLCSLGSLLYHLYCYLLVGDPG